MAHLEDARQTYFQHMKDCLNFSFISLKAMVYFLVHGISPELFVSSGSEQIFELNELLETKLRTSPQA
jgi:hypothetical protein